MRKVEQQYRDQTRWDEEKGLANLALVDEHPERFVVTEADFNERKRELIALLGDVRGKQVLEVGSGRGEISVALAARGAAVTGIELGGHLVALAGKIAHLNGVDCHFVVGSIDRLPFADQCFDFVVGNAILHHLPRQGVRDAMAEAYRVLRPGGQALYLECLENSKLFDLLQNLIPVDKPGDPMYRPSILQRRRWREFLETADDRALTNAELLAAGKDFQRVDFKYYGMLIRLARVLPGAALHRWLARIDQVLTHRYSPIKKLSQGALITFHR